MNKIIVNGQAFNVQGQNVSIINGVITVGGNTIISDLSGQVDIRWEGDLASLRTDSSVTCSDIQGSVEAGGSISCKNIAGDVNAGGSVKASGHIGKSINAGGSVKIN